VSLIGLKVVFAAAVFTMGASGVLFPWVLGRRASGGRLMVWGDTFAGGVLAGAGLVHLLSGGVGAFRELAPSLDYPLAFLLAGFGFLLILLI
jgi:uncharacterized membrane protein